MFGRLLKKDGEVGEGPPSFAATTDDSSKSHGELLISPTHWNPPQLDNAHIRILVFQENTRFGKVPLFDSLVHDEAAKSGTPEAVPEDPRKPPRKGKDVELLGEMVFGSVPLAFKGTTTKIHMIRTPPQLMMTKVFTVRPKDIQRHAPSPRVPNHSALASTVTSLNSLQSASVAETPGRTRTSSLSSLPTNPPHSGADSSIAPHSAAQSLHMHAADPHALRAAIKGLADGVSASRVASSSGSAAMPINMQSISPISTHATPSVASSWANESVLSAAMGHPGGQRPPQQLSLKSHMQRRKDRSKSTSIEHGHFRRSGQDDDDAETEEQQPQAPARRVRRPRFAVCVIFSLHDGETEGNRVLHDFFFSHFAIVEARMRRLLTSVMGIIVTQMHAPPSHASHAHPSTPSPQRGGPQHAAGGHSPHTPSNGPLRDSFPPLGLHGHSGVIAMTARFRREVQAIYSVPRVQEPVWLNMTTFPSRSRTLSARFVRELSRLVGEVDGRRCGFFLSSLFTAVLSHHLAWVPTVAPTADRGALTIDKHESEALDVQAKFFPYNPLWAQLGDLYGCLGMPPRLARTVIVGANKDLVCRLLYVASYFVRCNEVFETVDTMPTVSVAVPGSNTGARRLSVQYDASPNPSDPSALRRVDTPEPLHAPRGGSTTPLGRLETVMEVADQSPSTARSTPRVSANASLRGESTTASSSSAVAPQSTSASTPGRTALVAQKAPDSAGSNKAPDTTSTPTDSALSNTLDGSSGAPFADFEEIPMLGYVRHRIIPETRRPVPHGLPYVPERIYSKTFGRSLIAGYWRSYVPDLAVMGCPSFDFGPEVAADLKASVEESVLDEPIAQAVCIVGDTNRWRCEIIRTNDGKDHPFATEDVSMSSVEPSEFVVSLFASLRELAEMGMPAETCIMFVEDRLQELYHRSRVIAAFVAEAGESPLSGRSMARSLGIHLSDLPLLVAVASTHTPNVATRLRLLDDIE